jgi:hypothetical protein
MKNMIRLLSNKFGQGKTIYDVSSRESYNEKTLKEKDVMVGWTGAE